MLQSFSTRFIRTFGCASALVVIYPLLKNRFQNDNISYITGLLNENNKQSK